MKTPAIIFLAFLLQLHGFGQDMKYAREVVGILTSPEFKGRGYSHKGDRIAAGYISDEFERLGLLPLNGNSYMQKFPISVNTFPRDVYLRLGNYELLPAVDFLFESSCPSVWGKFGVYRISRTDITTHGELLTIIENAGTSFILIDSRGKEDEDPKLTAMIDESINYLKYSNQIGIKGVIIYTDEKLMWEISSFQNIRPVLKINKELDIYSITDMEIKVDAVFHENYKTQNVAGYIEGTSGSDSTIVITAHYDHLGMFGKYTYFAGANDNASGVALMLNLAQHYIEFRPEYTTIFISFSAEELELKGSRFFTRNPLTDLSKIKFLINFDLAGTGSEGIRVVNGSVFIDKFNLLTELNRQNNLLPKVDIRGPACNSDHCPFYEKGVPCFYIYTQGGIQAYHEIIDMYQTLPLTEFFDYCTLMIMFLDSL